MEKSNAFYFSEGEITYSAELNDVPETAVYMDFTQGIEYYDVMCRSVTPKVYRT
jgi:hypothetical protein